MPGQRQFWIVTINEPIYYGRLYAQLLRNYPSVFAGVALLPFGFGNGRSFYCELLYRLRSWGLKGFLFAVWRWLFGSISAKGNVARAASSMNIPLYYCRSIEDVSGLLNKKVTGEASILVTVPEKIPVKFLSGRLNWVNTHCGALPRYAGVDAPFWALLNGEVSLAVSLHVITDQLDAGALLRQACIKNENYSYFEAVDRLFEIAYCLHEDYLSDAISPGVEQNLNKREYYSRPEVNDADIFRKNGGRFI